MSAAFSTLSLAPALLANLASLGYEAMTPIQAASLPVALAGRDLIAKAKTGSGKTAAFGISLLARLDVAKFRVQALVLCPTRELADQVGKELRRLARFTHNVKVLTLCGGVPLGPQLGSLEHGAHIVVGTPGRIQEHLRKGSLQLDQLATLVLDEADRMLDMGFQDSIDDIIAQTPATRQTLLFSATYPDAIRQLSAALQREPVTVSVDTSHGAAAIRQLFFEIDNGRRLPALLALLARHRPESCVIFCNTKQQCQDIATALQGHGVTALALHGDLEQRERDQVLVRFANNSCPVLVATDVAARGLDIKDLAAVINFELPRDPEVHVHRIGRTGRAGREGLALSLYTAAESARLAAIERYQNGTAELGQVDTPDAPPKLVLTAPMATLCIDGGRKDKIRPGDILGALTGADGIAGTEVGKIDIFDFCAYVAVRRDAAGKALKCLADGKIKGRKFKARKIQ
jgi:ATP-independent RNA helicase DbpA